MTAEKQAELLACPFCGSPPELEHGSDHHGTWFNLGCSRHWGKNPDDTCPGGRIWYTEPPENEADAIKKWNTRGLAAGVSGVPEGWKLVPKEPTKEMVQAGAMADLTRNQYKAMLAAAPER